MLECYLLNCPMVNTSNQLCPECVRAEVRTELDISCVLKKLADNKGIKLSDQQEKYLCLWLSGFSDYYIAYTFYYQCRKPTLSELLHQNKNILGYKDTVITNMSRTVHTYVKNLILNQQKNLISDQSNKEKQTETEKKRNKVPHFSVVVQFFREQECQKKPLEVLEQKFYMIVGDNSPTTKEEILEKLKQMGREMGIDWDNLS